eukprot:jgi/Botrbrau1/8774/Bobra.0330s0008.1
MDIGAAVSKAKRFLRVIIPVALSIDMVHNIIIITRLAQARLQEWREEEKLALISRVESVLWRVVHRCNTMDQAFWPPEVSLKRLAIPSPFAAYNGLDLTAASQSKKRTRTSLDHTPLQEIDQQQDSIGAADDLCSSRLEDKSHPAGSCGSVENLVVSNMLQLWQSFQSAMARRISWKGPGAGASTPALEGVADEDSTAVGSESAVCRAAPSTPSLGQGPQQEVADVNPVDTLGHCPLESLLGPLRALQQAETCTGASSSIATPTVIVTEPTGCLADSPRPGLPDLSLGPTHWAHAAWLLKAWNRHTQPLEDGLHRWSSLAREHVPVPSLEITRKSALRWDIRWHGMSWPPCGVAPLERVLTDL